IKRGEPLPGDPDAQPKPPEQVASAKVDKPRPAPRPVPEEPRPKSKPAALPKLDQLLPTAGDLMREGVGQPDKPAPAPAPQQQASTKRTDLLRHGDPWRTSSLRPGSMDFLPAVREGDITM